MQIQNFSLFLKHTFSNKILFQNAFWANNGLQQALKLIYFQMTSHKDGFLFYTEGEYNIKH